MMDWTVYIDKGCTRQNLALLLGHLHDSTRLDRWLLLLAFLNTMNQ